MIDFENIGDLSIERRINDPRSGNIPKCIACGKPRHWSGDHIVLVTSKTKGSGLLTLYLCKSCAKETAESIERLLI